MLQAEDSTGEGRPPMALPPSATQEFLEEVERKLNERPRKRHGFLSPNQVFSKSTGLDARVFV